MSYQLLQRLQAWTEGALPAGRTEDMLAEFLELPVWFPGTRHTLPEHPGKTMHRLHLVPGLVGSLPTLRVWLDDPAGFRPPNTEAMLQYNANTLLVFATIQRFNVALEDGKDHCFLRYDDLLSLRSLMLLSRLSAGEKLDPTPEPDLSALQAPIASHAEAAPGLHRAWLALVRSVAGNHAVVMLEATEIDAHFAILEAALDPLLPPGVSLTLVDAQDGAHPHLIPVLSKLPPLYDAGVRSGWVSRVGQRVKQRFSKPAVPVVELDIRA